MAIKIYICHTPKLTIVGLLELGLEGIVRHDVGWVGWCGYRKGGYLEGGNVEIRSARCLRKEKWVWKEMVSFWGYHK